MPGRYAHQYPYVPGFMNVSSAYPLGKSEREQQWTNKMTDIVNKQRHELCAKDHKLSKRNEEVEAVSIEPHEPTTLVTSNSYFGSLTEKHGYFLSAD